ncbi:RNA polymerase sigma-70 factor [uncultured Sunxiuqinia sp.]|uniref:RNA polymerase sigma factor n=1 Tax=uncultured Sunxiuqinia sp. TaxID=1573825 RepID=UPI00262EB220|nr:RNA polymerase sigma-70 factor [uncultured Sunxiuqinia sp.]
MIDRSLNTDLKTGNPSSYDKLYALTSARLKNYCKIFLNDHGLVEDVVQDAYVRLWEKRNLIKADKSVESLLFTIVRNQCLNHLRDQKLHQDSFSLEEYAWSDLQHLYQIDFTGGEEVTLEEQLYESLKEAIEQLPERQQQVLVKCKIEGRKQQDVADELDISVKAVEKNLAKAKKHLRTNLVERFPELSFIILLLLK